MNRFLLILGGFCLAGASAHALEITVTPGSLQAEETALKTTQDAVLTLKGTANVTDLALLRHISPSVTRVNMEGLDIKAYTYTDGDHMGRTSYAAGELPPYMLAGANVKFFDFPATGNIIIGDGAFSGTQLMNVQVPASVSRIGDYAYSGCPALVMSRIVGTPEMGKGIFQNSGALQSVVFTVGPSEIPENMFDGCSKLKTVDGFSSATRIGAYAFRGTALTEVDIHDKTYVGDYAFANMPELSSIVMSAEDAIDLGKGVFFNDKSLTLLPAWTGPVSDALAANVSAAINHELNSATIGEGAFANNAKVTNLTLGDQVKTIKPHAFRNMTSLEKIDVTALGTNVPDVEETSFSGLETNDGTYNIELTVGKNTKDAWEAHPVWSLFNINDTASGVNGMIEQNVNISVVRQGGDLTVSSFAVIDSVDVYTMGALRLAGLQPQSLECVMTGLPEDDVLIVKVVSGGISKIIKVM